MFKRLTDLWLLPVKYGSEKHIELGMTLTSTPSIMTEVVQFCFAPPTSFRAMLALQFGCFHISSRAWALPPRPSLSSQSAPTSRS